MDRIFKARMPSRRLKDAEADEESWPHAAEGAWEVPLRIFVDRIQSCALPLSRVLRP